MKKTMTLALTLGALVIMGTTAFAATAQPRTMVAPVSAGDNLETTDSAVKDETTDRYYDDCDTYNECGRENDCRLSENGRSCCR